MRVAFAQTIDIYVIIAKADANNHPQSLGVIGIPIHIIGEREHANHFAFHIEPSIVNAIAQTRWFASRYINPTYNRRTNRLAVIKAHCASKVVRRAVKFNPRMVKRYAMKPIATFANTNAWSETALAKSDIQH